jgi:O-antigen/teichoic acid export membrane protein
MSVALPLPGVFTPFAAASRNRPGSLRANFTWMLGANLLAAASQWAVIVLLARMGDPAMVGQYTLGLAVCAPVFLLAGMGLRTVQATDSRGSFAFRTYLSVRLAATAVSVGVILVAAIAWRRPETALAISAVAAAKAADAIGDVYYGLLQQNEIMGRIAKSMAMKSVLSILVLAAVLYFVHSALAAALALAAGSLGVLLAYDLPVTAGLRHSAGRGARPAGASSPAGPSPVKSLVAMAAPLGVVMMLASVNGNLPRYFVANACTERDLGLFSAVSYAAIAGNTVVMALAQAACPAMARKYADRDRAGFLAYGAKLLGVAIALGASGVAIAHAYGGALLGLLYGPEYAAAERLFVYLMAAGALSYLVSGIGYIVSAARYFRVQVPLFAIVCGATWLACAKLVPLYGVTGAALGQAAGLMVQLAASLAVLAHALWRGGGLAPRAEAMGARAYGLGDGCR